MLRKGAVDILEIHTTEAEEASNDPWSGENGSMQAVKETS